MYFSTIMQGMTTSTWFNPVPTSSPPSVPRKATLPQARKPCSTVLQPQISTQQCRTGSSFRKATEAASLGLEVSPCPLPFKYALPYNDGPQSYKGQTYQYHGGTVHKDRIKAPMNRHRVAKYQCLDQKGQPTLKSSDLVYDTAEELTPGQTTSQPKAQTR